MLFEIMDKGKENASKAQGNSRALTVKHDDISTGLKVFNLLDERELAQAEVFLKKIIATDKGGIKSVNEGLAILMRAQDLQLPFSGCIEHIHVINGKTGVDIHIIKALLLRAGVVWKCTKDYTPQYQYTDGSNIYNQTQLPDNCVVCKNAEDAKNVAEKGKLGVYPLSFYIDLKGNVYNEFTISSKCVKAINKAHAQKIQSEGNYPIIKIPPQPIDFVTEYEFKRYRMINGKEREMTAVSHFSYSEAQTAELLTKDTYKKYARILIGHRAFTLGARDIASDVLMGVMETGELKIVENIDLSPEDYEIVD